MFGVLGVNRIYIYNNYKDKLQAKAVGNSIFVSFVMVLQLFSGSEKRLYRAVD